MHAIDNIKAAGVVVLYNPDQNVIENIDSYINQIDRLFVVDNSEIQSKLISEFSDSNPKCEYIFNNGNLGIASALNIGARKAIEEGYNYLLTLDQDSIATSNMVKDLLNYYIKFKNEPVGIVTAFHNNKGTQELPKSKTSNVLTTMTSGNLLSLDAYRKAGPFKEDFFIDYVDKEYCLRLKSFGYNVVRLNYSILIHNLGNAFQKKILFRNFYVTNHSPIRIYYRTRNRFRVINEYKFKFPFYCIDDLKNFLVEIFKIVFYEEQVKEKLVMLRTGFRDYKKNIVGKY